jgi:single-strand DNA-binding protein
MRYTPQGHAVTTFRVASNRTWRNPEGTAQEDTEWFRVVAWNRLAEICNQWLSKGSRVYVEGRMQTRQWQDQEGQTRYLSEVVANDIIILDTRRDNQPGPSAEPAPRAVEDKPPATVETVSEQPEPAPRRRAAAKSAKGAALPRSKAAFEEEDLPF